MIKRVTIVFGTRPEAVKMAPVILELKHRPDWQVQVIVSGQHREMLDQVLEDFGIQPDCNLAVLRSGQGLAETTGRILLNLDPLFVDFQPDWVLVHGDTATTLAAALTAFYRRIPVAHVEAGLRSGDISNPFPEEANRRLVDQISSLHFAPTEQNAERLRREGFSPNTIFVTGNTVVDAVIQAVSANYQFADEKLAAIAQSRRFIVVTVHRRENWGEPLRQICRALKQAADQNGVHIVFAVHKNPLIQKTVYEELFGHPLITLADAPRYRDFVNLLSRAYLLVTDSGGLQEEAPALNIPVLVLRDNTERQEAVEAGTVKLIGRRQQDIVSQITKMFTDGESYQKMVNAPNPYGDGRAAFHIRRVLDEFMSRRERNGHKT